MNEDNFIQSLQNSLDKPLPGEDAHSKMLSYNRPSASKAIKKYPNAKQSAVLILMYKKQEEWVFPLIQRPVYNGVHSAQMALPGGKIELQDVNLQSTALRESNEEIGINSNDVDLLGQLTPVYIPPSGYLVTPFIGKLNYVPHLIPEPREVDQIVEMPIRILLDDMYVGEKDMLVADGVKIRVKYFRINAYQVWGATAMMLSELKEILNKQ